MTRMAGPASSPAVFNIGEVARRTGVSARMVRHYEGLGLLPKVARTESGYRQYGEADVHTLQFIKRSRDLGFSMDEIAELVGLWHDRQRASAVQNAVQAVDPEAQVTVDLPTGHVDVLSEQPRQDLVAAIENAGYKAR